MTRNALRWSEDDLTLGRPFWQVPRKFIMDGQWASLPTSAKAVLPAVEILGMGSPLNPTVISNASLETIAKFTATSPSTVLRGLRALVERGLASRERRYLRNGGHAHCRTHLNLGYGAHPKQFGVLSRCVVTGGSWALLPNAGKALYVPMVVYVQRHQAESWAINAWHWTGKTTRSGEAVPGRRAWFDKNSQFSWHKFMTWEWNWFRKEEWADFLPHISRARGDDGRIGLPTLAKDSGLTVKSVRRGLAALERYDLILTFPPPAGSNIAHRFVMPPEVDWYYLPGFLNQSIAERRRRFNRDVRAVYK